jgi:hypothetical protein
MMLASASLASTADLVRLRSRIDHDLPKDEHERGMQRFRQTVADLGVGVPYPSIAAVYLNFGRTRQHCRKCFGGMWRRSILVARWQR